MRIPWRQIGECLYRAIPFVAVAALVVGLESGCAGPSARTTPAESTVVQSETNPSTGATKTTTVTTKSPSGTATGPAAATLQQHGTTAPIKIPGGPSIGAATYDDELWGKAGSLSVFWWATFVCLVATLVFLATGHTVVGLCTCFEGCLFALCIASPWCILVLAGGNAAAMYFVGRHYEGMRAVIATAKKLGHWDTIKGGLHEFLGIGDNAAVKAAERAET